METLVTIVAVGAYAERQYQKQDGTSKNRDTQYYQQQPYVVKGFWKHRTWQDKNGEERHENAFYITDLQSL